MQVNCCSKRLGLCEGSGERSHPWVWAETEIPDRQTGRRSIKEELKTVDRWRLQEIMAVEDRFRIRIVSQGLVETRIPNRQPYRAQSTSVV